MQGRSDPAREAGKLDVPVVPELFSQDPRVALGRPVRNHNYAVLFEAFDPYGGPVRTPHRQVYRSRTLLLFMHVMLAVAILLGPVSPFLLVCSSDPPVLPLTCRA